MCEKVGLTPGFFSVDAGAGTHHYILRENGKVVNVDKKIEQLNHINWLEAGYQEGDIFSVYGKEYAVIAVDISMFLQKKSLHQQKLFIHAVQ